MCEHKRYYEEMIKNQSGLAHVVLSILVVVVAAVGFTAYRVMLSSDNKESQTGSPSQGSKAEENTPPILAKNIGFKFDKYDPQTKRAGDLVFSDIPALSDKLVGNRIWQDFGVPDNKEGSGQKNPQTVFILPAGTKITAMVDGEVVGMTELYSKDYGIMIAKDKTSKWRYEHEHVVKPTVKLGDKVKAGDVIAEVGAHTNTWQYAGYGIFEIGLYRPHPNGVGGSEDCVFKFLDASVKQDVHANVTAFYDAWEQYRGDTSIYNQEGYFSPGCASGDTITWEQVAPVN